MGARGRSPYRRVAMELCTVIGVTVMLLLRTGLDGFVFRDDA